MFSRLRDRKIPVPFCPRNAGKLSAFRAQPSQRAASERPCILEPRSPVAGEREPCVEIPRRAAANQAETRG
jgi:hypothetical protein